MKNIKFLALTGLAFLSQSAFSQNTDNNISTNTFYTKAEDKTVTGTQYYDPLFMTAKLNEDNLAMVRYNAYSDQIEVKKPNAEITALVPEKDLVITTSDLRYNYEFVSYTTEDSENMMGYLNRIVNNTNVKIYTRMKVIFQPEVPSNGYQQLKPANYKKLPLKYFIKIKDGSIVELSTNKKKVGKLFPGKEAQVTDFIGKNKLSLDKEADITKLADFLNTL